MSGPSDDRSAALRGGLNRPGRTRPKVAFIGTGGTIASVGRGPLDIQDYAVAGQMLHAEDLLARFPAVQEVAEVFPVRFRAVPSTAIGWAEWRELLLICDRLCAENPDLAGIVVGSIAIGFFVIGIVLFVVLASTVSFGG